MCVSLPHQPVRAAGTIDQAACHASHYDEKVTVKYVIDGDTIILADDRHVRLIGINAPEISHGDRPAQPGGDRATRYLKDLLRARQTINLQYDQERFDQYQRTLAHLFLEDGTNIQALLLERGLVATLAIPPNLEFVDCYAASSARASGHPPMSSDVR